ncbi:MULTISPECIES: glycine betaine ABC transporter substrate-binding protein [Staphylococcus]|uniref:Glycine betaine ABC transporter substrate-binding protein n=1 Tax=Staphylococcus hsinchuensis TaxID=3051183 RepID=A0ABZ3EDX5_9STAP|nr:MULTISPECIES: glycine betaine ABC transporter substrate-binding protein [unclassified Staphylococcus]
MFKHRSLKILGLIATLALAIVLSACGNGSSSQKKPSLGNKDIEIPYVATDNSAARSLVIAEVLKKAGYDVTTTPVQASGPLYADVSGNKDAFHASGIFPTVDKSYYDKFKSKITKYDKHSFVDDVKVGLAVPQYAQNINSISDLKDNEQFGKAVNHKIQGTDARNGVMKATKDEIGSGDLKDYELNESSDQAQFKQLQKAHQAQQPILFTAMEPSWIAKELKFKMLDDPNKIYGDDNQHINLVFNKDFEKTHPAAYQIGTRMSDDWSHSDEETIAKKMFVDRKNPEDVAKDYVDNNENKVDDWIKDIKK